MSTSQEQLKAVLDQATVAPTAPAAPPMPPRTTTPRPAAPSSPARERKRTPNLLRQLGESLTALFALATAGAMWYAGAVFTLVALAAIGIPVERLGMWQWAIPAGFSLIELYWWPRDGSPAKLSVFVGIAGADLLSTLYGVIEWGAGLFIPLGTGYTLPQDGPGLLIPAVILSLVLTFAPERLALWSISELRAIWRG
jgi:hypothetical protein